MIKKLLTRNGYQVLGKDLNTPSEYLICYSNGKGGTQQAIRIAEDININVPIFNLWWYDTPEKAIKDFKDYLINPIGWTLPF